MVTWNSAFEAIPADSDAANQGANKIRELKVAIRERLDLEMNFQTGTKPLLKAGIAATCYAGSTTQINALSSPSNGAFAYDTTLQVFKYFATAWQTAQIKHSSLANLADDDHPHYLSLNKANQTIAANVSVANGITVDGVDISALNALYIATAASYVSHAANNVAHANTFGAWSSANAFAANQNHTAATDGFVTAFANTTVMSGASNGVPRQYASSSTAQFLSFMFPVKKGHTWSVATAAGATATIYFMPIGS